MTCYHLVSSLEFPQGRCRAVPMSWTVGEETGTGDKKHGKRNDKGGYLGLSGLRLSPREQKELPYRWVCRGAVTGLYGVELCEEGSRIRWRTKLSNSLDYAKQAGPTQWSSVGPFPLRARR